jgi:hypothetical protein
MRAGGRPIVVHKERISMVPTEPARPRDADSVPSPVHQAIDHLQVALIRLQALQQHPSTPEHATVELAITINQLTRLGELLHVIQDESLS